MKDKNKEILNDLLEILHVISHDGGYNDIEFIEERLLEYGVSQEEIDRHKKKE